MKASILGSLGVWLVLAAFSVWGSGSDGVLWLVTIPGFAVLGLFALARLERAIRSREPVRVTRRGRIALVGIVACAIAGICASIASPQPYHADVAAISERVAPAILAVIATLGLLAWFAPSRFRIAGAATAVVVAWPILLAICAVGVIQLDVPASLEIPSWSAPTYKASAALGALFGIILES